MTNGKIYLIKLIGLKMLNVPPFNLYYLCLETNKSNLIVLILLNNKIFLPTIPKNLTLISYSETIKEVSAINSQNGDKSCRLKRILKSLKSLITYLSTSIKYSITICWMG